MKIKKGPESRQACLFWISARAFEKPAVKAM